MKLLLPILVMMVSTAAIAKSSKVNFRVYSCPKKEEVGGCHKQEVKLIDKDLEISFTPLKSNKDGVVDREVSSKHTYVSERINGMEFILGAQSDNTFLYKGKSKKVPEYGLIVLNVRLSDRKNLHYSDHVFFQDKTTNYFHAPLRTNDHKFDYFAELRSLE